MTAVLCPSCGRPPTLAKGDSITITQRVTFAADGTQSATPPVVGWCPACLRQWDARITAQDG